MIVLPRASSAFSILTSAPMPVSAPAWVCSRGSSSEKILACTGPLSISSTLPKKRMKPELEHAVVLRLEVGVHDADAPVVAEVFQHALLRALPPGQVLAVVGDHGALGRDVRPQRPDGGDQQRIAVVPGAADQGLEGVGEGHGGVLSMAHLITGRAANTLPLSPEGEGGEPERSEGEPGRGRFACRSPSLGFASARHPLPQGERGRAPALRRIPRPRDHPAFGATKGRGLCICRAKAFSSFCWSA